jgi:hypothetical protein
MNLNDTATVGVMWYVFSKQWGPVKMGKLIKQKRKITENKMMERKATSESPSKCGLLYLRGLIDVEKSLSFQ